MLFIKNIGLPLLLAGILIGFISVVINVILRLLHFDITIIKIILFFAVWYFVGPIIYQFLAENIMVDTNEILEFIYQPIQVIMGTANNLL